MTDRMVIGVDVGTQGVKAALFRADGRCLATAFCPSRLHRPGAGVVEEDPQYQLAGACRAVRQCLQRSRAGASAVAAIGIAGQMAGVIGIGADGRCVTPYDSWLDTRCGPYITRMADAAGQEVLAKTGNAPSFNHGPKILWWMHQRKQVFRSIRAFVQPGGYVAMRLCGLGASEAFIDHTYLHFSGFADNRNARWDVDLCRRFGLDPSKLPRIVEPESIVGEVCASMARRCGLRAGTPVVAGCGDTAASFLACGATRAGVCVDVAGTASVFAATTGQFRPDRKHLTLGVGRAATSGLWHPYAYINGGGMNLEWFRREIAGCGGAKRQLGFDALDRLAGRLVPSDDDPLFIPHLAGRVSPGWPNIRGAWAGLNWSHSAAHLYRSVLEAVALEYGIYSGILSELYPDMTPAEVRVTGGGQKSQVWNSIKADVLRIPVVGIVGGEGAPMGSAMLAGLGAGMFKSLPAVAGQWVRKAARVRPDRALADHYSRRVRRYQALLERLNEFGNLD